MNMLERVRRSLTSQTVHDFQIGDTIKVHVRVVEGERERLQIFEGTVIARKGGLNTETFTVRKLSHGVGVERVFPIHSPGIEKITVIRRGKVRRAKLYYLRGKKGKDAKVKERDYLRETVAEGSPTDEDSGGKGGRDETPEPNHPA